MVEIKYKLNGGEIIAMGNFKNIEFDNASEGVAQVDAEVLINLKHYKYNGSKLVKKSNNQINKIDAIDNFSIEDFMTDLEDAVGESKIDDLSDQLRRLERFGERRAFGKIKRLGERLVTKNRLTQQEFDGIKALFLSKGIDLGDY